MITKYWKDTLVILGTLGVSIIIFINGEEYLGEDVSPIMFSIFFTGTLLSGMWLVTKIMGDRVLEEVMEKANKKPTEKELKEREKWAGKLELINLDLVFTFGEKEQIKIEISDLKVIGELTTEADIVAIDWYLIIVKKNNEVIYLPAYASGLQNTLEQLSKILNHEIVPKLFASAKFDSNVIYPKSIEGEKLFDMKGLNPTGVWEKIKVNWGFSPITPILRKEVIELKYL